MIEADEEKATIEQEEQEDEDKLQQRTNCNRFYPPGFSSYQRSSR